jgi:predicted chitinase
MSQITVEQFKNFFKYYKNEEHQQRAIEMLYEEIDCMFADHLDENSKWIQQYRTPAKPPAGNPPKGIVTPYLMEQLTGYKASAFDQLFCDDCNRLFADTGFDKHLNAMQMLMANMMHETANFIYMKEIASGEAYNNRSDLGNGPTDGPKYKGAGVLQLTGRYNYQRLADGIGDPKVMDGVDYVSNTYPFTSARVWIEENRLLDVCLNDGFDACCKRINGGWNGYGDRVAKYEICKRYMV